MLWLRWVFVVVVVGTVALATGWERLQNIKRERPPCGPDLALIGLACEP